MKGFKRDVLTRLLATGTTLKNYTNKKVVRGITTGFNDAFVIENTILDNFHESKQIIKAYSRGQDTAKWTLNKSGLSIFQIESSDNRLHAWSNLSLKEAEMKFSQTYPDTYQHIKPFRKNLIDRYDQGQFFWELRACTYWDDFSCEKIVSTKISLKPTFALDKSGSVLANTAYFIPVKKDGLYLLSILNSTISYFISKQVFVGKGDQGIQGFNPRAREDATV